MEAANAVKIEISNGVLETNQISFDLNSNVTKEEESSDNEVNALPRNNELDEDLFKNDEVGSSVNEVTTVSPDIIISTKKVRLSKAQKAREEQNGNKKNPKARLSQSKSILARGSLGSNSRKSTAATKHSFNNTSKIDVKNSQTVDLEGMNGGVGDKLTTAANESVSVKSSSEHHQHLSDPIKSNDGDTSLLREIDDARSAISSTTPIGVPRRKSTGSVFSFRLDERAERRKEFYTKLGEKINAMELEKTNLQEKSKESQEAELRQLRKSLTFKAAPMPSFYRDPDPPKIELKKKAPTRARSPKLGRNKSSSAVATSDSSDAGASKYTKPNTVVSNGNATTSKKYAQKSLAKLPSHKSTRINEGKAKLNQITANHEQTTDKAKEEINMSISDSIESVVAPSDAAEVL